MNLSLKLPAEFYQRDTTQVAGELLGTYLVHEFDGLTLAGRIVEVEAFLGPEDLAAHASRGVTQRTRVLFGPPGHAYIYLVYGLHFCFNVVTGSQGEGCAVLVRALEPVHNLLGSTRGPGLVCRAMRIDLSLNAHDLQSGDLYISPGTPVEPADIVARPRIGVDYAGAWAGKLLRFYLRHNPFISRP